MARYIFRIHDRMFTLASKDLVCMNVFIHENMPSDISEQLHPDMLPEPVDSKTISPDGRIGTADAVYRCYLRDGESYIYVVIEHKSYHDGGALLQIDRPAERLWNWEMSQNGRKAGDLPQVFGIVLYHGKPRWKGPRNRVEMTRAVPGQGERNPGEDHYVVVDVRRLPPENLAAYPPLLRSVMKAYALAGDGKATPEQVKEIAKGVDRSELGAYL